jgi:hypothetical protein
VFVTLIEIAGIMLIVGAFGMVVHSWREARRREGREIVRRVQRYLDALPPARPW